MSTFVLVVGWLAIVLALFACAAAMGAWCFDAMNFFRYRLTESAQREAVRDVANSMLNAAWWFSEDDDAMKVLELYGQEMLRHGMSPATDSVREKWREWRKTRVKP